MPNARSTSPPKPAALRVEIFWGADILAGAALAVVDVLRTINVLASMRTPPGAPVVWRWWSMDGSAVPRALAGPGFQGAADLVVVPGWHAHSGPHLRQLVVGAAKSLPRLAQVHARGGMVAGLYNGVALVAEAGLLEGRSAVIPWPYVAPVLRYAPAIQLVSDRAWTQCERVWSCDTPVIAAEVALDMLRHTPLADLAQAAAQVVLHAADRQQAAARVAQGEQPRQTPSGALELARHWLETHVTEPYSLLATAQAAATSPRTLLRWFSNVYGQSPLDYLHSLRVGQARVLLETTYDSVDRVAHACGYQDVGTFRRIFQRETGELPGAYRERYHLRTSRKRWRGL